MRFSPKLALSPTTIKYGILLFLPHSGMLVSPLVCCSSSHWHLHSVLTGVGIRNHSTRQGSRHSTQPECQNVLKTYRSETQRIFNKQAARKVSIQNLFLTGCPKFTHRVPLNRTKATDLTVFQNSFIHRMPLVLTVTVVRVLVPALIWTFKPSDGGCQSWSYVQHHVNCNLNRG